MTTAAWVRVGDGPVWLCQLPGAAAGVPEPLAARAAAAAPPATGDASGSVLVCGLRCPATHLAAVLAALDAADPAALVLPAAGWYGPAAGLHARIRGEGPPALSAGHPPFDATLGAGVQVLRPASGTLALLRERPLLRAAVVRDRVARLLGRTRGDPLLRAWLAR